MGIIKSSIGQAGNFALRKTGCEIVPSHRAVSLSSAFTRIAKKNIEFQTAIDIGASHGTWSKVIRRLYPAAFYFLIEANKIHEPKLKTLSRKYDNIDYVLAAAGDTIGELYFDESDPFGGLASHTPLEGNKQKVTRVPATTVDTEVNSRRLKPPYLLKLDTHGFEVPILEGAAKTLKETALVIVEVYNFTVAKGSLRFHELCAFLESKNFRTIDICDPLFRPKDGVLWQMDLIFAKADRKEFQLNTFE